VGEDTDVEWRLNAIYVKPFSLRYLATCFHLNHKRTYTKEDIEKGMILMREKQKENLYFCRNGITKKFNL